MVMTAGKAAFWVSLVPVEVFLFFLALGQPG
jgi:hypothetical protein